MNKLNDITVEPCADFGGIVTVPGDKSVSHRAAMLTGLASGQSIIEGFLVSEDCLNTLHAVRTLGATVMREGSSVKITGTGGAFQSTAHELDMGNSGTGMRLLSGLLAGHGFVSVLTGDESLMSRPMKRIREPLERMGAEVELQGERGCAPIRIKGGGLRGIWYQLPMASAQVKSCVLLAGLFAEGKTTVMEPRRTRDHTERMLLQMGADVTVDGLNISLEGSGGGLPVLKGMNLVVPGDFSSAAFWLAAAASHEGAKVTVEGVGLNPRRTAFLDVLRRMGAEVEVTVTDNRDPMELGWEPIGTMSVQGVRLKGTEVGGEEIPNLIDELPLVGVVAAMAEGKTVIRDAAELRVKESDRIAAMARVLTGFGVKVEERDDGMVIHGAGELRGHSEVDSQGDHRIAMAGAILALFADGPTKIRNIHCVATSYPSFWDDLEKLSRVRMVGG